METRLFHVSQMPVAWNPFKDIANAIKPEKFAGHTLDGDSHAMHDTIWLTQSDHSAACVFSFAWSARMDGKDVSGRGRGTTILRREADGWRIASEHLSNGRWKPKA